MFLLGRYHFNNIYSKNNSRIKYNLTSKTNKMIKFALKIVEVTLFVATYILL